MTEHLFIQIVYVKKKIIIDSPGGGGGNNNIDDTPAFNFICGKRMKWSDP